VVDELHTYRGVFGSHLCNVLRRLRRIARFYGREPQFICSSATIANPGIWLLAFWKQYEVLNGNGAPSAEKSSSSTIRRGKSRSAFAAATSTNPRVWHRNS